MFKIIGGDGNEYGPVSVDTLRQWQAQGRVNAQTRIKHEGGDWATLGSFQEFAGNPQLRLAGQGSAAPRAFGDESEATTFRARSDDDNYTLNYRHCLAHGWQIFKRHPGLFLVGFLLWGGLVGVLNSLGKLPFDRTIFGLIAFIIGTPLMAGLQFAFLRGARGESPGFGNLFAGFKHFGQILLAAFFMLIAELLCFLPALAFAFIAIFPTVTHGQKPSPAALGLLIGVGGLCWLPVIYLQVSWMFALPLVVDRQIDFWSALKLSSRRVNAHWWQVFGLRLVLGIVALAGALALGFGLLLTVPLAIGALMVAYENIFPDTRTKRP